MFTPMGQNVGPAKGGGNVFENLNRVNLLLFIALLKLKEYVGDDFDTNQIIVYGVCRIRHRCDTDNTKHPHLGVRSEIQIRLSQKLFVMQYYLGRSPHLRL